ncbi:hypothetical protein SADUNF_Sadunf06G0209400 [Salix dunnii]|uniref:Uncharacterized protein n=1 Tax=Salix dunnii TaxID=1413687 RepID=A0A835K8H8_9ROSI|nr:hypothetical protein SADUNF_Sadunf06G0209400 [Salix dunnii]
MMDEWVTAAMSDETLVAKLLLRLKQPQAAASASAVPAVIPFRWGIRLPRSRPGTMTATNSSSLRCDVVLKSKVGGGDSSTRCSPTTPLSWSGGGDGGASPSGTGDCFEETSRRHLSSSPPPPGVRSKGAGIGETTSNTVKRSRKKKTFSELKEEETQLEKERVYLKKEISTVRATFKEERVRNENLKRIKIDLNLHYGNEPEASTTNGIPSTLPTHAKGDSHLQSSSSEIDKAISNHDRSFLLPDLNMMPSDEGDSGTETLYGVS